ncbi:MAG: hypothetical protein ACK4TA_15155 [Saprospiraceae bacterium]
MRIGLWSVCFLLSLQLTAQSEPLNKGTGILVHFGLGAQVPGGDLADRFGFNMNVGGGLEVLTAERNFIFGLQSYFLLGSDVKENPLANLTNNEGFIVSGEGNYADIQLQERGYYIGAMVGKLFSLSTKNPRSGIRATLGAGLLQHKIHIQDDPVQFVPQLQDNYKKGYDRLTNGLAIHTFVGYQMLSVNKRINFYVGMELTQGFTQNRRSINFDTRNVDSTQRTDLLLGARAGLILPFYGGKGAAEIYY